MPDVTLTQVLTWPIGVTIVFFAFKYLWPSITQSFSSQAGQWRSESKYIAQMEVARDKAVERADKADARADELFSQLANVNSQLQILNFKLESANAKIEALTATINEFKGSSHV